MPRSVDQIDLAILDGIRADQAHRELAPGAAIDHATVGQHRAERFVARTRPDAQGAVDAALGLVGVHAHDHRAHRGQRVRPEHAAG